MTNRIRQLLCGHPKPHVEDYGDDDSYRWRVVCRTCGAVERWSQAEWRLHLTPAPRIPAELLRVADDEPDVN